MKTNSDELAWDREFKHVEAKQNQRLQALLADDDLVNRPLEVKAIESQRITIFNRNFATTILYIIAAMVAIYFMFWSSQ
ncbi:hypothetical protein [Psychrobacter sp. BF1]|uniref:hypothetical protein n=1 Tax=Psychrobacter sp. BF1 TaxID=2821147 RepID=UPI001C4DEF37|nr:hypothetical protein [Psychrobacter sp. BF1]